MTARQLTAAFERWREAGKAIVLASVFDTRGSTYSKAGAQMLIDADGDFQGMLSGGCLEGDLAERARQVLETGQPQSASYDLGQNDEELWGLGVGCDGLMKIFLQALGPNTGYEPFASMCRALEGDTVEYAATVLESAGSSNPPGASLVTVEGDIAFRDLDSDLVDPLRQLAGELLASGCSQTVSVPTAEGELQVLLTVLKPPPRILVLGAGLDARPLVQLLAQMGWRVIVQDHRPAYIAAGHFTEADQVLCVPARELASHVDFARIDAVVVMSHHLVTDRTYLEILSSTAVGYIGLLGPMNRRERLLSELGDLGTGLRRRVKGPAGIKLGGSGPSSIALSIVAHLHRALRL
jgi:xanthine/CO dehydrogenase XdhC/CoxF family maturation factor